MTTQLNLQADQAGTYPGLSAQFSGPGFSDMRFTVRAASEKDFAEWVAQTREHGGVLDGTSFAELARPTREAGELSYGSMPEDPFELVAAGDVATHWSPEEAL
jgi:cytochrome o ubiquinol oxidase subunit II